MYRSSMLDGAASMGGGFMEQQQSQKISLSGIGNTRLSGNGTSGSSSTSGSTRVGTPNVPNMSNGGGSAFFAPGGSVANTSVQNNNTVQRAVHFLSPAGLSADQTQRVQSLLASGAPATVGPRLRASELLHFWISSESTVKALEEQVFEVLRAAGLKSGGSDSSSPTDSVNSFSPKAPGASVNKQGTRSPHATNLLHSVAATAQLQNSAAYGSGDSGPLEQPPALELAVEGPREDMASTVLTLTSNGVDDLHASMGGSSSHCSLSTTEREESSPRKKSRNLTMHPKSPRSVSPSLHGTGNHNLSAHYHIVDEVDAAHARGALSPRSISPALQLNQDIPCVPQSPLGADPHSSSARGDDVSSSMRRNGSPANMMEGSSSSATNTPRRHGEDGRPSRSPSPANSRLSEDSRVQSLRKPSNLGSGSSGGSNAPPKPRHAGYQDIPRFYFAEGKPQTQSTTLIGPHSKRHENPHLTLFEGVAVPVGAQAQMILAQQQMQGGGGALDLSSLQPQGPKLSPMLPLAVMEDEDVVPFIQREFARLPAPPPKQAAAAVSQQRTKGSSVLRRPTTSSSSAPSKQEQAYRQALTATMHRVCTQAFGLPKYIGQLVFRKLSADAEAAVDETITTSTSLSGRPGTSSGAASSATPTITVAMVKEFYEKHLRFKSIIRRMFEVLIATSKSQSAPPAASFSGALGGVAPSVLASSLGGAGGTAPDHRRNYIIRDDFINYVEVLLESHPGLGFLRQTQDFQGKYLETVIIRIFYDLDRFDRGRISWPEFENSKLPDAIRQVDATDDINTVLNYFSYEHFYVLYCRFWELDEDRDMLISPQDLQKYAPEGTMNPQIVERVFQGHGRKLSCKTRGKMNYEDFVWFCLSEEDKTSPKAIRYWFRVLDIDGDGVLCGYEMESFYAHTKKQLLQMTTEGISFADVLCQVSDMLPFSLKQGIRLGDLLSAPQAAHVTFNMIMNVIRFLQFEQRDPFVAHHERLLGGFERNDWDRFARQEYDRMAQEADGD